MVSSLAIWKTRVEIVVTFLIEDKINWYISATIVRKDIVNEIITVKLYSVMMDEQPMSLEKNNYYQFYMLIPVT